MEISEENIEIINPSKKLFILYEKSKREILSAISEAQVELIGSLAVPMKGKKEIDIMIIGENIENIQNKLALKSFLKGPIVEGVGYCRKMSQGIIIELHILSSRNKKIKKYRKLIKILQKNSELRTKLENLKLILQGKSIKKYRNAKNIFFKKNNLD